MYENFYNFKENPFSMSPDPKFFFPSQKHSEALDSLIYTIKEGRGFAVVTGDIGSGKTIICRTLLERLDSGTKVAMITNTYLSQKELIASILTDFGVSFNGESKASLINSLRKYLAEQLSLDYSIVLIVDEAQNLQPKILEEIRMLSNLETEKKKMIQIILMGQPELKDKLALQELTQLRQRVNVHYHVTALGRDDAEQYINHRMNVASISGESEVRFTSEAVDEIYRYSRGIPRMINRICNSALIQGYVLEVKEISQYVIKEVVVDEFKAEPKNTGKTSYETKALSPVQKYFSAASRSILSTETLLKDEEPASREINREFMELDRQKEALKNKEDALNKRETTFAAFLEENKIKEQEFGELVKKVEFLKQSLPSLEQDYQERSKDIIDKERYLDSLKNTIAKYESEELIKESKLNQVFSALESKEKELLELNSQCGQKAAALMDLNQKLNSLSQLMEASKENMSEITINLSNKASALKELEDQFSLLKKDIPMLEGSIKELEAKRSALTVKVSRLAQKLMIRTLKLKNLKKDLRKANTGLSAAGIINTTLNNDISANACKLKSTLKQLYDKESRLKELEEKLKEKALSLAEYERELLQKNTELKDIVKNFTQAQEEIAYIDKLSYEKLKALNAL